ncbi:MAG: hypothetical protein ABI868_13960 [Acidobacteriota bacterium]
MLSIFSWTPQQRAERWAYFLREEQRPRRQSILAVAEELADLNTSLYEQQQHRTAESESRLREDLSVSHGQPHQSGVRLLQSSSCENTVFTGWVRGWLRGYRQLLRN